jgi:hypothetical protein
MKTVTLDTNVADDAELCRLARATGYDTATCTVTDREFQGTSFASLADESFAESFVLDESGLDHSQLQDAGTAAVLERILQIISSGSFPLEGERDDLSPQRLHQLRDAMILAAHIREGRDILVSNDQRAFVSHGRREALRDEFGVCILTSDEFSKRCHERVGI